MKGAARLRRTPVAGQGFVKEAARALASRAAQEGGL